MDLRIVGVWNVRNTYDIVFFPSMPPFVLAPLLVS